MLKIIFIAIISTFCTNVANAQKSFNKHYSKSFEPLTNIALHLNLNNKGHHVLS